MKSTVLHLVLFVAAILALGSCGSTTPKCEAGVYTKACPPSQRYYENKIVKAKEFLSNFEGQRARDLFKSVDEEYRLYHHNQPSCDATYGVMLADGQVAVKNLNGLVFRLLTNAAIGAPPAYSAKGLKGGYKTAAQPQDLGVFMENGWSSFEPVLGEMSYYAETVTTISKCTFSIGAGDKSETYEGKVNPYKYVLNIGDSDMPLVQIVFTGRFDAAEARLLDMIVRSVLGTVDFALAHDYSLTLDVTKLFHQLGLPSQCVRENIANCIAELDGTIPHEPINLLEWSFLFADNPKLLGKSALRWDQRFPFVDNEFAGGFYGMRTFFDSLLARTQALELKSAPEQELDQYIIVYKDGDKSGTVNALDDIGINITAIHLSPEFLITQTNMENSVAGRKRAEDLRTSFKKTESLIETGLLALKALHPTEGSVDDVNTFFERFYGNMKAVDFPDTTAERIPISSFNRVIEDFGFGIFNGVTPDFMEFDLRSYFINPKPLRKYLPYWEHSTETTVGTRFLADSDDYGHMVTANGTVTDGTLVTLPQVYFDQKYGGMFWASDKSYYQADTVIERSVLQGTYDGGSEFGVLSGIGSDSDCVNANNIFSKVTVPKSSGGTEKRTLSWPVMTLALQDASINNVIYTDLGAWTSIYNPVEGNGDIGTCLNPSGFAPATNYSLTKSMWMYVDYIVDHFTLTTVLGALGIVK